MGIHMDESLLAHGVPTIIEFEGKDDDDDLDLHTPLPHILLREGMLSPRSKVLTASRSSPFSDIAIGGVRDSVVSTATDGTVLSF